MKSVASIREARAEIAAAKAAGRRVAFVPTMGFLHAGHLALFREARQAAERRDDPAAPPACLVASIFVNPRQFEPHEDLSTYPRDFERDAKLSEREGVDLLFYPSPDEIYPKGYGTSVNVGPAGKLLCGLDRPRHFDGVATVVLKLFNIVEPSLAVFGWKDAQQLLVLKRMVRDFNLDVELLGLETVRESDGLAMSSRNVYLTPVERAQAPALRKTLLKTAEDLRSGADLPATLAMFAERLRVDAPQFQLAYADAVAMDRLERLERYEPGNTLLAAAARLGKARLIDNARL